MGRRPKAAQSGINEPELFRVQPHKIGRYNAAKEKEANIIGRRLAAARYKTGMSLAVFIKELEKYGLHVGPNGVNKWENGETVPNAYQLFAVMHALGIEDFRMLCEDYKPLLNDVGLRKVQEYRADLIAAGKYRRKETGIISMPVSDLSVSAGTGAFLDEGGFTQTDVPKDSVPLDADFGIRVSGDSMEPVYIDGQIVWVQRCKTLQCGEVGIFVYDGEGYIKVYDERKPTANDDYTDSYGQLHMQPVMVSYNKKYDDRYISPEMDFQIIGRVLN